MNNTLALNPPVVSKSLLSLNFKFSLRIFLVFSILAIATLLVFYIFQVNAEVRERYLIQRYEKKITEISRENQNLEMSLTQINSLDNILALMETLNFEKANKIHYIRVLSGQVVTK